MTTNLRLSCDVCGTEEQHATDDWADLPEEQADDNVTVYAEEFVSRHAGPEGCTRGGASSDRRGRRLRTRPPGSGGDTRQETER